MSNHIDQFNAAVMMIVGHGDIKVRLISAFEKHLAVVDSDVLPDVIKNQFTDLRCRMTGVEPLKGEGQVRATVRKMSIIEAEKCAQEMLAIYIRLLSKGNTGNESVAEVNVGSKPRIPPFLVRSANS